MRNYSWLFWVSCAVSATLLIILLIHVEWSEFWSAVINISLDLLALAAFINLLGLVIRAFRWNVVAGRTLRHYWHFWRSTIIGYLGNFIYPLRAGELLRVLALSHFGGVPIGQAVTSSMVDRVCDGLMLAIFITVITTVHSYDVMGTTFGTGIISIFVLLATLVVGFVIWGSSLDPIVNRFATKLPKKISTFIQKLYKGGLEVATVLRQPSRLMGLALINGLIAIIDLLFIWVLLFSFGWDLPFWAAITLLVFLLAGSSLPSGPGYIGVYQLACVLALGFYGIEQSEAIAFATVLQLVILGVSVIQGIWSLFIYGFRLQVRPADDIVASADQRR